MTVGRARLTAVGSKRRHVDRQWVLPPVEPQANIL
jgi:hypothetical protein